MTEMKGSTLAQIKIGVKFRLCAEFDSHPEAGVQNSTIIGEGFNFVEALNALAWHVKDHIYGVVQWAESNNESYINPIRVYTNNYYYYYIPLQESKNGSDKLYIDTANPSLYEPYCSPKQKTTLYGPSGWGMSILFKDEDYKAAEAEAMPEDWEDQIREYLRYDLKELFDNAKQELHEDKIARIKKDLQNIMYRSNFTKEDVADILKTI